MNRFGWLTGILLLLLSSCDDYTVEPENFLKARPLTAQEEVLLASSNNFSFELLKLLQRQEPDQNIFFSSIGIGNGLGMAFHIIDNRSKKEIKEFLHIENVTDIEIDRAYFQLSEILNKIDPDILFVSANSFWINQQSPIDISSENRIMAYYDADVQQLNFQNSKNIKFINNWAEDRSFGRVKEIFPDLIASDRSYMVNLLYFDMNESLPFRRIEVNDYYFTPTNGKVVNLPYGNQFEGPMQISHMGNYRLIDIPMGKGNFTISFLIPDRDNMLPKIIEQITFNDYVDALASGQESNQGILLPDMTLDKEVRMQKVFPAMGVSDTIRIINYEYIANNLFVSDFVHKASFTFGKSLNEPESKTANIKPDPSVSTLRDPIVANRSFLFFIREKSINAIIFAGKINVPEIK